MSEHEHDGGELVYRASDPAAMSYREQGDGGAILEGRMMPYGEWTEAKSSVEGHFMETFAPGPLAKTMRERAKRIRALFEHGLDFLGKQPIAMIDEFREGGSFGKYINVEKAVQIGLLPDMEWSRFEFLGNTSVKGAYYALLDWKSRERIKEIASRMTYVELSADNSFYDAFTIGIISAAYGFEQVPQCGGSVGR